MAIPDSVISKIFQGVITRNLLYFKSYTEFQYIIMSIKASILINDDDKVLLRYHLIEALLQDPYLRLNFEEFFVTMQLIKDTFQQQGNNVVIEKLYRYTLKFMSVSAPDHPKKKLQIKDISKKISGWEDSIRNPLIKQLKAHSPHSFSDKLHHLFFCFNRNNQSSKKTHSFGMTASSS